MLGFTYNQKKTSNPYQLEFQQQYQPLTITNMGSGKPNLIPAPHRPNKKIVKSHSNNKIRKSVGKSEKQIHQNQQHENKPWNTETVTKTVGVFDRNLKKDTLAAQERQIRANLRIEQNAKLRESGERDRSGRILTKEEQIYHKKIEVVTNEQQREIQRLKQMIQKQRLQKQKNDLEFEEKKRKIQQQRKRLIQIQRQIQRQGPKATKEMKQKIQSMQSNDLISQDRVRLKQTLNQQNPKLEQRQNMYNNYTQLTQSQSIANQKNKFRQQQLQYLVDQRQRNFKQYQKNTLGYTPTLIPLLSKASYKIVSTHISSLVELLIDQMLQQQVYLLQAIQLQAKAGKEKQREKQMLHDYVNKLQNFVQQAETIQQKLGKYNQMRFEQIYKPSKALSSESHAFSYSSSTYHQLELKLTNDDLEELNHRIGRFKRYVSSFDEYKNVNMDMFRKVTEECIDEAIEKLAKQLDNGAGEFVNLVFRSEFE